MASLPVQNCLASASTVPKMTEKMMARTEISMVLRKPAMMNETFAGVKIAMGYASFAGSGVTPGIFLARGRTLERRSSHCTSSASGKQMMKYSTQAMM